MSTLSEILKQSKNNPVASPIIHPVPDFELEHYGAADGGHAVQVSSPCEQVFSDVENFAVEETGLRGWINRVGFPRLRKDGKTVWVLWTPK